MVLPQRILEHPNFRRASIFPPDVLIRVPRETNASGVAFYTDFYCHKSLIAFGSEGLRSALCGGWKESHAAHDLDRGTDGQIEDVSAGLQPPSEDTASATTKFSGFIVLNGDNVTAVEQFLRLIYPHLKHEVTWANCQALSSFADKWESPVLLNACKEFLCRAVSEKPLLAMAIAERFDWRQLHEEAAGLALLGWPSADAAEALDISSKSMQMLLYKHNRALSSLCSRLCQNPWQFAADRYSYSSDEPCGTCAPQIRDVWMRDLRELTASARWNVGKIFVKAQRLEFSTYNGCNRASECLRCWKRALMKDLEKLFGIKLLDK